MAKTFVALPLARDPGITLKTAWFINHRLRLILREPEPPMMNNIVEVDETYVGGQFSRMSRARRKKWQESGKDNKTAVMGIVEREGKARLPVIGENTFKDIVLQNVEKTATVMTDAHLGYIGLRNEFAGHEAVNHSIQEYKRGLAHTNSVEGFFSLFKRTIFGTYHQISPKHLHKYCIETTYRFNSSGRLKYAELIKG